ncbi:MAG: hypothetical protein QM715_01305 [Nibricoccus sp.]
MTTQDHTSVDILGQDHDGTVVLIMLESREWSEIDAIMADLEKKFSAYMTFILKGGIAAQNGLKPSDRVKIDLRCLYVPPAEAQGLFQQMLEFSMSKKVDFVVHHDAGTGKGETRIF